MATVNEKMKAIADAIRSHIGGTEPLTLDDMASGVDDVYNKGGEEGYSSGIEEGKLAERNAFWETFQRGGARTMWNYTFQGNSFAEEIYNPIYPITLVGGNCTNTFYQTVLTDSKVPIDASGTTLNNTFRYAKLVTIKEFIVTETTNISNGFSNNSVLVNIKVTGTIGRDWNMSTCPLSVASLKSIITALKDFTGESEYSCTLTVDTSAFNALEAEGSTAAYNGTACTWAELVDNKKWNLVKG